MIVCGVGVMAMLVVCMVVVVTIRAVDVLGLVVVVVALWAVHMTVMMCVAVGVCLRVHLARFTPNSNRTKHHHDEHRHASNQNGKVELLCQNHAQHLSAVHLHRDEPNRPYHEDGQELLGEVIPERFAVVVMIVCHVDHSS
jgi:hypothetical protein